MEKGKAAPSKQSWLCCWRRGGKGRLAFRLAEVKLMHRSIGSILHALSANDQLALVNQAKRAFIRYVFHEVRVPFNAIVLGAEQLQHHAAKLRGEQANDIREIVTLVSEQATVVARSAHTYTHARKDEADNVCNVHFYDCVADFLRFCFVLFFSLLSAF